MSIAINDNWERDLYIAAAGQTVFTYSFPIYDETYLSVYQRGFSDDPDNATQLLVLGAGNDYTVTGVGEATGGTIVLNTGAALNDIIAIVGNEPVSRTSTFDDLNSFTVTMNSQLNQLTIMIKQVESILQLLTPKYHYDELVSDEVRENKLLLPILNDNEIWIGRGNYGDDPDDIITAEVSASSPLILLAVDYVIGAANAYLPNAQVLGGAGNGIVANVDDGTTGTLTMRTLTGTANQIDVANGDGSANPIFSISDDVILPGTGAFAPPSGTSAEQPGAPIDGMTRWNSDTGEWEGWDGGAWVNMVNTGGGVVGATYITTSDETASLANSVSLGALAEGVLINTVAAAVSTPIVRTLTGTVNQIDIANGTGVAGNPTFTISDNAVFPGNEGFVPPSGSTAQRPGAPVDGETRWNSDTSQWEGWNGAAWINFVQAGVNWKVIAANQTLVANEGYFVNGVGALNALLLPATMNVGDEIILIDIGGNGFTVTQNALQSIIVGTSTTTVGLGGSVESTALGNKITILCFATDADFVANVISSGASIIVT